MAVSRCESIRMEDSTNVTDCVDESQDSVQKWVTATSLTVLNPLYMWAALPQRSSDQCPLVHMC